MLEVKGVSKRFGKKQVLDSVTLTFAPQETVFVLGRSGVGKSVLLKLMVGLLLPDKGEVWLESENMTNLPESRLLQIRKKVGFVFQKPALLDAFTVFENIALPLTAVKSELSEVVVELLREVDLPPETQFKYPPELSQGMQKRVAVARALGLVPKYLLFDEPTTGLDPKSTNAVRKLIQKVTEHQKTGTIVVSHDVETALELSDRIVLLETGKVAWEGSPQAFKKGPIPLAERFLKGLA